MKYIGQITLWWVLLLTSIGVQSQVIEPIPQSLYERLQALSEGNFREKSKIATEIANEFASDAVYPLSMLLNSELYVDENQQLFRVSEAQQGEQVVDLKSGEVISTLSSDDLDKVRTNNRLRKSLKQMLAEIRLVHGSDEEKTHAIKEMLGDMDDDKAETVAQVLTSESSSSLIELMELALAIYAVEQGEAEEVLVALPVLNGRIEPEARAAIVRALERFPDNQSIQQQAQMAIEKTQERIEFFGFVEKVFFGLSLGSVLLLAAIGLAITFGVMGVINMAHGEMIMLGAYTTYVVQLLMPNHLQYSILVAIPAAFLVSGVVGVGIQQGVIRFLNGRPLETLLATFGLSLVLQQAVRTIFSPLNRQVASPEWMSGALEINPVLSLTFNRLYILAFSLLVFSALIYVMKNTNLGLNVRAVSQNRNMARAMGVRTQWVDAMTFGLGSGVAGVAGVALSQLTNVGPNLGQAYIIDSFMVVVFGGVGNLLGTLVASFSLGVANKFMEPVTGAVLAKILVLVFIILFIQKRPKGLFPQKGRAAE